MEQIDLFGRPSGPPDGFSYLRDFLSEKEAAELIDQVAGLPFAPFAFHGFEGKRRTVSYGWRYTFEGGGKFAPTDPIPAFLLPLRDRAARIAGIAPGDLEQMLVTEYAPGAGIGWHKDKAVFGTTVAVSIGASCRLRFRRSTGNGWQRHTVVAEPRSLYILAGESRTQWEHSIPPVEQLRYSITMRDLADRLTRE